MACPGLLLQLHAAQGGAGGQGGGHGACKEFADEQGGGQGGARCKDKTRRPCSGRSGVAAFCACCAPEDGGLSALVLDAVDESLELFVAVNSVWFGCCEANEDHCRAVTLACRVDESGSRGAGWPSQCSAALWHTFALCPSECAGTSAGQPANSCLQAGCGTFLECVGSPLSLQASAGAILTVSVVRHVHHGGADTGTHRHGTEEAWKMNFTMPCRCLASPWY